MSETINPEAVKRFMASKERAKRLIQMDSNGTLDRIKENAERNGTLSYDENGQVTTSLIENAARKNQEIPQSVTTAKASNALQGMSNSKLPKEILESFANNNIDTSMLGVGVGQSSVLDLLDNATNGKLFEHTEKPVKKVITTEQTQPIVNQAIDYPMIKMIVEDCVKKYTSSLKKSILAENKTIQESGNELRAIKFGDKFSFIDSKGNLYEAKLKFIKNINN